MENFLMTAWLLLISIFDIRNRRVPIALVVAGGIASIVFGLFGRIAEGGGWQEIGFLKVGLLAAGTIPGVLFLLLGVFTKLIGYADGIVLLCLGMVVGFQKSLRLWALSLFLIGVWALVLLVTKKATRKTKIPYLPFLTAAWLLGIIWGS